MAGNFCGILGVDARLDRMAAGRGLEQCKVAQFSGGLADHPFDEVDAGDLLGDAVLDLQAGVDLEE